MAGSALSEAVDHAEWTAALDGTRDAWRSAYDRLSAPRPQRALALVGADPERSVSIGEPERICGYCGEALAPSKRPNAVYCSRECQRAANGRVAARLSEDSPASGERSRRPPARPCSRGFAVARASHCPIDLTRHPGRETVFVSVSVMGLEEVQGVQEDSFSFRDKGGSS